MRETLAGFCKIGDRDGRAEYACAAERVLWWSRPTRQAVMPFFARAIVLNEKWVALDECGLLDIDARPAPRAPVGRAQLSRRWTDDGDAALAHCRAIGIEVVRCQHNIEIPLALCQAIQHALLRLFRSAYRDQFEIAVANHDDAVGGSTRGVNTAAACQQAQPVRKLCGRPVQVSHTDDDMVDSYEHRAFSLFLRNSRDAPSGCPLRPRTHTHHGERGHPLGASLLLHCFIRACGKVLGPRARRVCGWARSV